MENFLLSKYSNFTAVKKSIKIAFLSMKIRHANTKRKNKTFHSYGPLTITIRELV